MGNVKTLTSSCFQQIQSMILNGDLAPGEKLKGEYLKQQLQVGLSPIREALAKLTTTGLVEGQDKIGYKVSAISEVKVYEVFKTYAKIECLLLKEAIADGDEAWEARIMAALYRLAKIEQPGVKVSYQLWSERNEEFHNSLISGCNLNPLLQIRNSCVQMKDWYTRLAYKSFAERLITAGHSEHLKIAELAIARDSEQATTQLYSHLKSGIELLIHKLKANKYLPG